jgi:hypothetical protein
MAIVNSYPDGRPVALLRLPARDQGIVLRHGDDWDRYGIRDVWVFSHEGTYYLHFDAAGEEGWLTALATSTDGVLWHKVGVKLALGAQDTPDSASASYGVTYFDGIRWHLFYLGTSNTSPSPQRIPAFPYQTMKAWSEHPQGPWFKQSEVIPIACQPDTYYAVTASPGPVFTGPMGYRMILSAATSQPGDGQFAATVNGGQRILRTLAMAHTEDLNGQWRVDPEPLLPLTEQIENAALYYEPTNSTWFLFTNHVGVTRDPATGKLVEFTDAIWVYWSRDLEQWDPAQKAVVLDGSNCLWSPQVIGLPAVLPFGNRLAIYYDGFAGYDIGHMGRDIGLAWLDLPLQPPSET